MKKLTYAILSLCLCTAGLGTAAHYSPSHSLADALTAVNDTIDTEDEEDEIEEDEEEDDDFGFFTEEEEAEFGEMHDDEDDDTAQTNAANGQQGTAYEEIELTEGMIIGADEQQQDYNAKTYLSEGADAAKQQEAQDADAAEYTRRLRRMPVIMDMPYNDIVRKYIDQYTDRMRHSVSVMLGAQNFYNPIFEEALEAEGCPLELKYLPVIESAYNPSATSPVGAAGLWQFMPSTAKTYGLEVNTLVDERRDPIKSSQAAAKYLKYLHSYYGDWNLVIAAYNCGPGNVNKAMQRAGGSKDYWEIYGYLPKETRGYVPAFIAANYVMQYYCDHGIAPMECKLPVETDTIMVSRDLHLQQVAELCGVELDQLRSLNPQYRQDIVPGYWKPCALRLPYDAVSSFITNSDSIYKHRAAELLPRRSTVSVAQAGTTASSSESSDNTSRSYANSYSRSNNSYSRSNNSYSRYDRSSKNSKSSKYSKKDSRNSKGKKSKKSSGPSTVTLRSGDNLTTLAKRHGTTVEKLKKLNGMKDDKIRAGKTLKVK